MENKTRANQYCVDKEIRTVTKEDIEFLKNLQNEMLTQDTIGQANPRFWVIAQYEKNHNIMEGYEDGYEYILNYNGYYEDCENIEEVKGMINNWYEELNEFQRQELEECNAIRDIKDFILDAELDVDIETRGYTLVHTIKPNTFFLTNREAKEHIKANSHHYNDTVHTYAMTAWRSPQVEQLYNILLNVDFAKLEGK